MTDKEILAEKAREKMIDIIVKINGILTGLNISESEYKEFRGMEMMK